MRAASFGRRALGFHERLEIPGNLPAGIEALNPYGSTEVRELAAEFFHRYFSDNNPRTFVFGINPGRFGGGLTGVAFTDPVALESFCGIRNDLEKRREISSEFIYAFIQHWGGPTKFYSDFFLTAVSAIGFTRDGVNCNYYDDPMLLAAVKPFIVRAMNAQLSIGARRGAAILLGSGRNREVFDDLNEEHGFFRRLYTLEHPRFIMQYRRRRMTHYLQKYSKVFAQARAASLRCPRCE